MVFIGRKRELTLLEQAYASRQSALIPVYGRRRVGKSELILRFLRDKPGLYHLGKQAPAQLQIRDFLQEASRVMDEPLLGSLPADHWGEVFAAISDRFPKGQKFVLIFDEFQWTAEASPELPSILQEYWDRHWKDTSDVLIILCGSYIGFMERVVLGRRSPLYGRRTAQILLRPFSYAEAAEFHPQWSLENRAMAYFICGGVPLYLNFFDPAHSIEKNIEENILNEFSPLFREPDFLLREELREIQNYYAVLMAIAQGASTNVKIAALSGIAERSLHYYLQQLSELGYVARRYPLTGAKPSPRSVRYVLEDPMLRFWFRFVFANLGILQRIGPNRTLREIIRPQLNAYFGHCFESLCREALPFLYEREGIGAAFTVGQYWDKEIQIDVVALRDDNWTDLGECKWGRVRSQRLLAAELDRKASLYPNPRNATIGRRLFLGKPAAKTDSGSQNSRQNSHWHCLQALYP